jgi:hypothetical protein
VIENLYLNIILEQFCMHFLWGINTGLWIIFHVTTGYLILCIWGTIYPSIILPAIHQCFIHLWFLYLCTAVRLGDQCFYGQACAFTDQHATCVQIEHNAVCQCKPGYHSVSLQRPTKKVFCSEGRDHLLFFLRGKLHDE